jgi:hypothetical protein
MGQFAWLSEQHDPFPEKVFLKYLTAKNSAPASMAIRIIFCIVFFLEVKAPSVFPSYPSPRSIPPR